MTSNTSTGHLNTTPQTHAEMHIVGSKASEPGDPNILLISIKMV